MKISYCYDALNLNHFLKKKHRNKILKKGIIAIAGIYPTNNQWILPYTWHREKSEQTKLYHCPQKFHRLLQETNLFQERLFLEINLLQGIHLIHLLLHIIPLLIHIRVTNIESSRFL